MDLRKFFNTDKACLTGLFLIKRKVLSTCRFQLDKWASNSVIELLLSSIIKILLLFKEVWSLSINFC